MGIRGKCSLRFFLGVVLFFVASWLVLIGIAMNRDSGKTTSTVTLGASTTTSSSSNEMLKHWKWNGKGKGKGKGKERSGFHFDKKHLIYVSKRRVPNGPDPIHNRRAVKTRQPPSA